MNCRFAGLIHCHKRHGARPQPPRPRSPAHRVHRPCLPRQSEARRSRRQGRDRAVRGACGPLWAGEPVPKVPVVMDAGPVTGECLAPGLHRCEAARVTSER